MSSDKQSNSDDQQTGLEESNRVSDDGFIALPPEDKAKFAGGNMTFSPGNGAPSGSIVFELADGSEMMRFDDDGKAFVRGEQVDDNQGIYMHFRRWMQLACIIPPDNN